MCIAAAASLPDRTLCRCRLADGFNFHLARAFLILGPFFGLLTKVKDSLTWLTVTAVSG